MRSKKHVAMSAVWALLLVVLSASCLWAGVVPYGDYNIDKDPVRAKQLYPDMLKDWYDKGEAVKGVALNTPAFVGDHGSDLQGVVGWTTSEVFVL